MKNSYFTTAALAALALVSCQKAQNLNPNLNNPQAAELPSVPFCITVQDQHPGISEDSTYVFRATLTKDAPDGILNFRNGTTTDPVQLVQTPYNTITFEADADVNASSSDACLDIVKTDARHYRIAVPQTTTEGTTQIRFWNGGGNAEKAITLQLKAAPSIRCEGFELRLGGETFLLKEQDAAVKDVNWSLCRFPVTLPLAYKEDVWTMITPTDKGLELINKVSDTSKGILLEFLGTVPRNATPDNRIRQYVDPIVQSMTITLSAYDGGYPPFHLWNKANYPDFSWLPKGNTDPNRVYYGSVYKDYYPADLRYRRAWIWNQNPHKSGSASLMEYFGYSIKQNGPEKKFWGAVCGDVQDAW